MDVFALRDALIGDYRDYVSSFIRIRDDRIREKVDTWMEQGRLWPHPMVGLNPTFEFGGTVDDLVAEGVLHPDCAAIFRVGKSATDPTGEQLRLYRHQVEAIREARAGNNYVLTTGTGSGKSLAYIIPIVDHVLRAGSGGGVKAIVVYPMNALANSQEEELRKFLDHGATGRPVRFARYTGQEDEEQRKAILDNPPDIILTNYVMLELILTRIRDRDLVTAAQGLKYLVLDELHTYRGRQGADVAMLVRRVRHATNAPGLQRIGTSATLASGGSADEERAEVARVAGLLFGAPVGPQSVIRETLERTTTPRDFSDPSEIQQLIDDIQVDAPPTEYDAFVASSLAAWIEEKLGVESHEGQLRRVTPRPVTGPKGVAKDLVQITGVPEDECVAAIERWLLAGYQILRPDRRFSVFAFRLHQFISKGDTVYATVQRPADRFLSLNAQTRMPGHPDIPLYPLVFCRACGQDYYSVARMTRGADSWFVPEALAEQAVDEETQRESGYLMVSDQPPWPSNETEALERLPDEWREHDGRLKSYLRKSVPLLLRVSSNGHQQEVGTATAFIRSPFRFCLACGVSYAGRVGEFSKLGTLGSEGRSTATTLLTMSTVRALRATDDLGPEAKKVLSFTDNRQDASLQAGHFNDFVQVAYQRGALLNALNTAGGAGIRHDELPQAVFEAMDLDFDEFAKDNSLILAARADTETAFRDVLEYRLYVDLERGWRLTAPNLEQCGLLEIEYASLQELCDTDQYWADAELHPALQEATPAERFSVCRALLDWMRRDLSISAGCLDRQRQEQIKRRSDQRLEGQWALDPNEPLTFAKIVFPRSVGASDTRLYSFLSGRSAYANYLRRPTTFSSRDQKLTIDDTEQIIKDLLKLLTSAGITHGALPGRDQDDVAGYQLSAASMIWKAGDGTIPAHDPIRMPNLPDEGGETNEFFVDLYCALAGVTGQQGGSLAALHGMEAREHTAQVDTPDRLDREAQFRAGDLPILFCSPTMELGVDIAQLNVVNMRNVPPTPANYAQRSGRAGRSGQPALVFTYCSKASQHDQYFFRRPHLMVSGQVTPPRLDLTNEDLLKSHVHAVWLAESGLDLGRSLTDVLDIDAGEPRLRERVVDHLEDTHARRRAAAAAREILADLTVDLAASSWWSADWLERQVNGVRLEFERACERWIGLFESARQTADRNHAIAQDPARNRFERERAESIRREAIRQLGLLYTDESVAQSDFYSYRYFATEGFLPGYSFPRLPLSAFIPGVGRDRRGRFVTRPRFLAITEFGPRTFVYHEGSRYQITRVILPPGTRTDPGEPGVVTSTVKRCTECGYLHTISSLTNPDRCERCDTLLSEPRSGMFRLHNVSTRRRQRINSDEEERQRSGFDIETAFRFSERDGKQSKVSALTTTDDGPLLTLTYGETADIWRINLGERRRANPNQLGFVIDVETGDWARSQAEDVTDPDSPDAQLKTTRRVIPYVQDSRNVLLVEPAMELSTEQITTFANALKNAIQAVFQLEDQELAAETLPDPNRRRSILLIEAAEGGAGVLRRLLDEPDAMALIGREALDILHFDPATGADQQFPPDAEPDEQCSVACYDCLLGYRNQADHLLLNRHTIVDTLLPLTRSTTNVPPERELRTQSGLEKDFLAFLVDRRLRQPNDSQRPIPEAGTQPDFVYDEAYAVVYVDGPAHDYPDRQQRDAAQAEALRNLGYTVIRFGHRDDWDEIVTRYPDVFGNPS